MGHILLISYAGWGHLRPQLHFALNLLEIHTDSTASFLCHESGAAALQKEIDAHYPTDHPNGLYADATPGTSVRDRIQLVPFLEPGADPKKVPTTVDSGVIDLLTGWAKVTPPILGDLIAGHSTCGGKENKFPKPVSVVVTDSFCYPFQKIILDIAKEQGRAVPQVEFFPVTAGFQSRNNAPLPGMEEGKPPPPMPDPFALPDEVLLGMAGSLWNNGKVIEVEGGKYYDYEFIPMGSYCIFPPNMMRAAMCMAGNMNSGELKEVFLSWDATLEPIQFEVAKKYLKPSLSMAGPQFPESYWRGTPLQRSLSGSEQQVVDFLDDMQRKHGEKSVAYFSLGSTWYPFERPEIVTFLLESLTEAGIPWVYTSLSSLWKEIPPEIQALVEKSNGKAFITPHAPQWEVLLHPATRIYLSHCGGSSAAEAIFAGVPVVGLPFSADQVDIAHLFEKHGSAITLHQCNGFFDPKFKELYDGTVIVGTREAILEEALSVWKRMKDDAQVERMRQGMAEIRQILIESRKSGLARKAMESFSKYLS